MLSIDTESLKKFEFRYLFVYLDTNSLEMKTRISISDKWNS